MKNDSIKLMPKCALCGNDAIGWITVTNSYPKFQAALCQNHTPNALLGCPGGFDKLYELARELLGRE